MWYAFKLYLSVLKIKYTAKRNFKNGNFHWNFPLREFHLKERDRIVLTQAMLSKEFFLFVLNCLIYDIEKLVEESTYM